MRSGDTLSGIIRKMYGQTARGSGYRKCLDYVLSLNPQIKNPNRIYPGNVLRLGVIPQSGQATIPRANPQQKTNGQASLVKKPVTAVSPHDADYFWALAWLEHNPNMLVNPGSVATGGASNLLSPGNTALITKVSDIYADYKKGIITRGQYDYQRKVLLQQLKKNVGPMERLLFGNKTTRESIRIARGGGVPATAQIERNFLRLSRVANAGKYGGIVLTGIGVTASCMQIAHTQDRYEKNEIFVEIIASTAFGVGAGVIIGAFLVSNPVGWGTAIVLAVGSVALAYLAGKAVRQGYDLYGNRVDLVSGMGIDRVCR